jgi:hypothetical protein
MWASIGESHVGSADKTVTPSVGVSLLGGVVMVFSHSGQLQGALAVPWWHGWQQHAWISASDAVVVWLAVAKHGCQWCHGGVAGCT